MRMWRPLNTINYNAIYSIENHHYYSYNEHYIDFKIVKRFEDNNINTKSETIMMNIINILITTLKDYTYNRTYNKHLIKS